MTTKINEHIRRRDDFPAMSSHSCKDPMRFWVSAHFGRMIGGVPFEPMAASSHPAGV